MTLENWHFDEDSGYWFNESMTEMQQHLPLPFPISSSWSSRLSFEDLVKGVDFIFTDDVTGVPIIKLKEPFETMDLIYIESSGDGVENGPEGRFNDYHGARIEDSSKNIVQFIYDYLVKKKSELPELPSASWMPGKFKQH